MKIELLAKNLSGFDKETALDLINSHFESIKHYWRWCERRYKKEFGEEEGKGYALKSIEEEKLILNNITEQEKVLKIYSEIRDAILNKKLVIRYCGGLNWDVEYIKDDDIIPLGLIYKKTLSNYYLNYNTGCYCVSCYGTSRPLELILGYSRRLGIIKSAPQEQVVLY